MHECPNHEVADAPLCGVVAEQRLQRHHRLRAGAEDAAHAPRLHKTDGDRTRVRKKQVLETARQPLT